MCFFWEKKSHVGTILDTSGFRKRFWKKKYNEIIRTFPLWKCSTPIIVQEAKKQKVCKKAQYVCNK